MNERASVCEGSGAMGYRVGRQLVCAVCGQTLGEWPLIFAPQHEVRFSRWECPICQAVVAGADSAAHRAGHVPPVTLSMYQDSFPNLGEDLLAHAAFLHCLTAWHAEGRCCQGEAG